jgi:hypothetical protein
MKRRGEENEMWRNGGNGGSNVVMMGVTIV